MLSLSHYQTASSISVFCLVFYFLQLRLHIPLLIALQTRTLYVLFGLYDH